MSLSIKALIETGSNAYKDQHPDVQRSIAVAAALELIAARMTPAAINGNHLEPEMNKLSNYADQIQAALKAK